MNQLQGTEAVGKLASHLDIGKGEDECKHFAPIVVTACGYSYDKYTTTS